MRIPALTGEDTLRPLGTYVAANQIPFVFRAAAPAFLLAAFPFLLPAQEPPQNDTEVDLEEPAEPGYVSRLEVDLEGVEMSLADVVLLAFSQNLDIQLQAIDVQISEDEIDIADSIYDPVLGAGFSHTERQQEITQRQAGETITGTSETRTESYSASLSQLIPSGATASVGFTSDRTTLRGAREPFAVYNPAETQRAFVRLTQPLLRNFGPMVTNRGLRISRIQEEATRALYRQEIDDRLADVMDAYWDLVFAIRNLEVQTASLEAAEELARVNEARVDAGVAPRTELLQARAQEAERRNDVIRARAAILASQDALLSILNWTGDLETWDQPILPVDTPDLYDADIELQDPGLIDMAISRRQDFRASELGIDIAKINQDVARWQRLPELNAFVELGASGFDDNRSDAFDDVTATHYQDYSYGLEFRYPIPNRRARAEYRQSQHRHDRAEVDVRRAELMLVTQVRNATRTLRTALDNIEATEAQVEAAQETLESERRRLEVGAATTFNVLEFQEALARAQVAQVDALVNYQKGLIELERSTGNLLDAVGRELGLEFDLDERVTESAWRGPDY